MPKHGSIYLYVHGNQKTREDGQPRTATSTLTQLLNYDSTTPIEKVNVSKRYSKRPEVCVGGLGRRARGDVIKNK